jgi:hypothetical protein
VKESETMQSGTYDVEARALRENLEALCVAVFVAGGAKGDGFSVVGAEQVVRGLPAVLREVADKLERQLEAQGGTPQ